MMNKTNIHNQFLSILVETRQNHQTLDSTQLFSKLAMTLVLAKTDSFYSKLETLSYMLRVLKIVSWLQFMICVVIAIFVLNCSPYSTFIISYMCWDNLQIILYVS